MHQQDNLTPLTAIQHNAAMSTKLDPLISEFDTAEEEAQYTEWLRAKVSASLADKRPLVPHDQVMAEMWEIIESKLETKAA